MQKTSDVVKEGDKVKVKLLGFDDRGKTRLSMKAVDQETGEDLEAKQKTEPRPRAKRPASRPSSNVNEKGRLFSRPFISRVLLPCALTPQRQARYETEAA